MDLRLFDNPRDALAMFAADPVTKRFDHLLQALEVTLRLVELSNAWRSSGFDEALALQSRPAQTP